jgi:hypothetical protein
MCLWKRRILRTARMTAAFVFAMTSAGLHPPLSAAAEVVHLAVNDRHGVYQLALAAILDAPTDDVRHIITDYAHIYRIDPSIVESRIMKAPDASVTRVRTLINDCVLFVCHPILRVEDVHEVGDNDIYSVVVPQLSNVRSGTEHWQIFPIGEKTRINYNSTLQPDFYVPPLIGNPIIEEKIRAETLICFNNIERLAQIHSQLRRAPDSTRKKVLAKRITQERTNAN